MFKSALLIGAIGLLPAAALAGQSTPDADFRAVIVQTGQGGALTVYLPTVSNQIEAPYALTGDNTPANQGNVVRMQFGQGLAVDVAR